MTTLFPWTRITRKGLKKGKKKKKESVAFVQLPGISATVFFESAHSCVVNQNL